jgi:predicted signal transduction protein with EAL and GGDEF domain
MLGATLGLETVAEGIENEAQAETLLELGCVAGQGFLFARSTSLDNIEDTQFMRRRIRLRHDATARYQLTATGRFQPEELWPRQEAG